MTTPWHAHLKKTKKQTPFCLLFDSRLTLISFFVAGKQKGRYATASERVFLLRLQTHKCRPAGSCPANIIAKRI